MKAIQKPMSVAEISAHLAALPAVFDEQQLIDRIRRIDSTVADHSLQSQRALARCVAIYSRLPVVAEAKAA